MMAIVVAVSLSIAAGSLPRQDSAVDRLVEADGLTLHMRCDGARSMGAPLVVLEAGAGNGLKTWDDVFTSIARFARVCAYDRPGLGGSSPAPQPRRPTDIVATLHALLGAAGERPPYVMAGHSWGGEIVRLYAMRFSSEVAGLVLIDSSHEDQVRRFAAVPGGPAPPPSGAAPATPPREQVDLVAMGEELSRTPWRANLPLVVLTRTPPADPPADPRLMIWQELQNELATRSPAAEHIVATHSGHYIQNDEPQLVVDALRRVVAAARRR